METAQIASLLAPFLPAPLADAQLAQIATYLDLLLRWNARLSLTAVREAEYIVSRHFGESLFAAAHLLPAPDAALDALDVGSGAGFPGLVVKIFRPANRLTLIEAHGKKATFLKEVVRALRMDGVTVLAARAESVTARADLVTLRAVERFEATLPVAASLLRGPESRLGLLIGAAQVDRARELLPTFHWHPPITMPQAEARVLLAGKRS